MSGLAATVPFVAGGVVRNGMKDASKITSIERNALPKYVQANLEKLEANNFSRSVLHGNKGIGEYRNDKNYLPQQEKGYYTKFDVVPKVNGNRGDERIIYGKGGEIYYTNNHYGDNPNDQPAFKKVE